MRAPKYSFSILAGISLAALLGTSAQAALSISDKATENVTCSEGVCSATAKKAVLNVGDLTAMLAAGSVTVESGDQAQDITVNAPFSWTSSNALTLVANRSLTVNKAVADSGPAALTLTYGKKGDLRFGPKGNIAFTSTSNSLTINGKPYTLVDSIASLASAIANKPSGLYALAHDYDASVDGTYTTSPITTPLTGTFEGLGNVISSLTVAVRKPQAPVGFISEIGVGGIVHNVGVASALITGQGENSANFGVLVGEVDSGGAIYNSFVSGKIRFTNGDGGGLVGYNSGTIRSARADVDIRRMAVAYQGGLIGANSGSIESSFSNGQSKYGGGLVGLNYGAIHDCYATGPAGTGGLVGDNYGTIDASYSTGFLKYGGGGLIGRDFSLADSLDETYWDLDTSGIDDPSQGAGNIPNDPGITGLTDDQLKSALPAGFDPKVWAQNSKINNGYPYLINNPPPSM